MALAPLRKTKGCRVGHRAMSLATTLDSEHIQLLIGDSMSPPLSNVNAHTFPIGAARRRKDNQKIMLKKDAGRH
jgi:hypothetical protein